MWSSSTRGFTLAEILIVVVILGILAAIIVPQFSNDSGDARFTSTVQSLQSLRGQINLYRNQHGGRLPGTPGGSDDDATFVEQMTLSTNEQGARSTAANRGFGDANFPCGPYLRNQLPANPFNGSRKVKTVTAFPATAPGGELPTDPGWVYEITSGRIRVNRTGSAPAGTPFWSL